MNSLLIDLLRGSNIPRESLLTVLSALRSHLIPSVSLDAYCLSTIHAETLTLINQISSNPTLAMQALDCGITSTNATVIRPSSSPPAHSIL